MWCSLHEVKKASGRGAVLETAKEFLFGIVRENEEEVEVDEASADEKRKANWLQKCRWLSSPAMELIILLRHDKAVVLTCSPSLTSTDGDVVLSEKFTFDDSVTAAALIPIVGGGRKSETRPFDWCCLCVGYDCGQLEFFTLSPKLKRLHHVRYSTTTVTTIRCSNPQTDLQELTVLYHDCLVAIDGLSLLTTLKACRSQIAFQQIASKDDLTAISDLVFKKWKIGQSDVRDFACAGVVQSSVLNQMEAASMTGGIGSHLRTEMPLHISYVCVGSEPSIGVFWAEEEAESLRLSEMMSNFADKFVPTSVRGLTGKLASWTFGTSSTAKKIDPETVKPFDMKYRSGLEDSARVCESLTLSPNRKYVAITDDLARVILFDVNSRCVLRIWKGYRDAQCGWLHAKGDIRSPVEIGGKISTRSVTALFLVVFAPRRGILEIWTLQNGPRVEAFTVDKKGRLLRTSGFILGAPLAPLNDSCWFIDSRGKLYRIEVPFQAALQDESSSHLHDSNLYRDFKMLLRHFVEADRKEEPLEKLKLALNEFKTIDLLSAALERTMIQPQMSPKDLSVLTETAELRAEALKKSSGLSYTRLVSRCQAYMQLLNIYAFIQSLKNVEEEMVVEDILGNREEDVADMLQLDTNELSRLLADTELNMTSRRTESEEGISREDEQPFSVTQFIRLFDVGRIISQSDLTNPDVIHRQLSKDSTFLRLSLRSDVSNLEKQLLGEFLFKPFMTGADLNLIKSQLRLQLTLDEEVIFQLFCHAWLDKQHDYSVYPQKLYYLIVQMIESFGGNQEHKWLSTIESAIISCTNLAEGLMLAIIVRPVSLSVNKRITPGGDDDSAANDSSQWEQLKPNVERWDALLKHLHLLLILETLLYQESKTKLIVERKIPSVSLKHFLDAGKSYLQETIAKYVAFEQLPPAFVTRLFSIDLETCDQSPLTPVEWLMCRLLKSFPMSLSSDKLMANCCWECCVLWNGHPDSIELLQLSVAYLQDISNAVLQHGVASLLWSTFIAVRYQNCSFLVEKVGKYPKDRLCRKDIGVTEDGLVPFVICCETLLRTLMAANAEYEFTTPTLIRYEDFVDDLFVDLHSVNAGGRQSLIELANCQKCTNFHLIKHHWHLALVLRLSLDQNLKPNRPMSLFDAKGRNAFHKSLYSHPLLPMADVDNGVMVARREFFRRLIDKLIDSLPFSPPEYQSASDNKPLVSHMNGTVKLALELAKDWAIELDLILRHQICCLYLHGYDRLAESMLSQVENKTLLGCELLQVVGQRLNFVVENGPPDFACCISPTVSTWLKSCDVGELKCFDSSVGSLKALLQHIDGVLTSSHAEHTIVEQLRELVNRLDSQ